MTSDSFYSSYDFKKYMVQPLSMQQKLVPFVQPGLHRAQKMDLANSPQNQEIGGW